MFTNEKLSRDKEYIDDVFLQVSAIYLNVTILIYPVRPKLPYNQDQSLGVLVVTPPSKNTQEVLHILYYPETTFINPHYQSIIPNTIEKHSQVCNTKDPRRHVLRDHNRGINKPGIRRLTHEGGVKRKSGLIYGEINNVIRSFLKDIIHDAMKHTEKCKRKTVTPIDVLCAISVSSYFDSKRKRMMVDLIRKYDDFNGNGITCGILNSDNKTTCLAVKTTSLTNQITFAKRRAILNATEKRTIGLQIETSIAHGKLI